jgi:hypothetical protein
MEIKKNNNRLNRLKNILNSTLFLTIGLEVISGVILFFGAFVLQWIFGKHYPEIYLMILIAIANLFFLFCCFFVVVRKEMPRPGLPSIKGFWAVLQGVMGLIVFGGIELGLIVHIVQYFGQK